MTGTSGPNSISTRLRRVAELAREEPKRRLTTLAHHVDLEFLREAFRRTRKDGAAGVDGQTATEFAADLEKNLQSLLERFKSGTYKAPPVRRVHIPKGDGRKTRPIGIPTFEDKVLQRAVAMLLEAVYEQDFLPCSYAFRPGRSMHQALEALWTDLRDLRGGTVVEVDIKGFFDSLDHGQLRSFLDQRVGDGVLRRTINKWLKAGVLEEGRRCCPDAGTPQGGVISPILANVYLHYVLDQWFHDDVRPRLHGRATLVRFADDLVIVCELDGDARRILSVLPKRCTKYGLTIHPEKTKIVPFGQPRLGTTEAPKGSFDFLGFTHFWARSRKGTWVVKRKTAKDRFSRAVRSLSDWCQANRHMPICEQQRMLGTKLRGHCGYYGITGNSEALQRFRYVLRCGWQKWLNRRSQRARMDWTKFTRLLERYPLPAARAFHSLLRHRARP